MTDVFLSYAREDAAFVRRLHDALESEGRQSWVDWEGIPPTAEWMAEIHQAIEAADSFVAVLTPAFLSSDICRAEATYAAAQGKRLIPIVALEVEPSETPDELSRLNWLFFRDSDDFDQALASLTQALDTDLDHVKLHTWLLVRCARWVRNDQDVSSLLRGGELETAESWLAASANKQPPATQAQSEFILAGRRRETKRQRQLLAGVGVALAVSIFLAAAAWVQKNRAETQRRVAVARALATQSEIELDATGDGLVRSALLAVESLALTPTQEGGLSWERAMKLLPPAPLFASEPLGETTAATLSEDSSLWTAGDAEGVVTLGSLSLDPTVSGETLHRWQAIDTLVESLSFSPDRSILAVGGRGVLSLWNLDGEPRNLATVREEGLRLDNMGRVHNMVFSPDGSKLYVAAEAYGIDIFETRRWTRLEPLETPWSRVFALSRHPELDLLVAGGFGVALLDPANGSVSQVIDARAEEIDTLTFSPSGSLLGTVDFAVRVWDLAGLKEGEFDLRQADSLARSDDRALALDFSHSGRYLAVARETGVVHVRAVKTGVESTRIVEPGPAYSVDFVRDDELIVTISDRLRVRPALAGEEIRRLDFDSDIEEAFLLAEGKWIVVVTRQGRMQSFLADGMEPHAATTLGVNPAVALSPDGRWLAAMGADQLVVLDASSLETTLSLSLPQPVRNPRLLFDPKSRLLLATGRGYSAALDLTRLSWLDLAPPGSSRSSWRPEFTTDGEWLALVNAGTRLLAVPSLETVLEAKGRLIAFDPLATRACTSLPATRGRDPGYYIVWDLESGRELGSVGQLDYLDKTAEEYGAGDIALAQECSDWPRLQSSDSNPEPPVVSQRWRLESRDESLLLFALQAEERIAEACRRLPRRLNEDEWHRLMIDVPYRPSCPASE